MASPGIQLDDSQQQLQDSAPQPAFNEAQKWIEQVTGKSFGDKDFRSGLENGILLCELLNAIKPGLVKKINKLPTPIAGLDNITLFLRGCKELGLKESQLFDPGDLQDTSNRVAIKGLDCSRKLKNVLVTIYWLGKAANGCTSYSGATLNLKEFEGLLAQMRKETEELESPKRSIRDSGYIDCWDSERSDSLSPPRHGRDDSFDSLDSFGSRSQQTPSPDVILRGSSDGRGSDSEPDVPHRKMPDVRKDDMSARRTSCSEPKAAMPFNQYLPNKGNPSSYMPAPLRKKRAEREEYRKSWSTATSPLGGERPFRSASMFDMRLDDEAMMQPHSRARYEHLQNLHNQMKEEEDKWQDDLARWKNRRRSASQDLIKKEEERKKIERLMSGEDEAAERRKSIKTYREIVEEKEHREKALHEAYRNAKTSEEAEKILQQYIERFTISEAVLERLKMPKFLERSQSVDSNTSSSPTKDADPMKYLRQQSLPAPKFTATVETTITLSSQSQASGSAERTSPPKLVSKAVPVLTPKPYSQPKNAQQTFKSFKVDGQGHMNGHSMEAFNGVEEEKECMSIKYSPSLTRSQMFEGVARVGEFPVKSRIDSCTKKTATGTSQPNQVKDPAPGPQQDGVEQLDSAHIPRRDQKFILASSVTGSSTAVTRVETTCCSNSQTRTDSFLTKTERKQEHGRTVLPVTKTESVQDHDRTELPVFKNERAQEDDRTELPVTKTEPVQYNDITELSSFMSEREQEDDRLELPITKSERIQGHDRPELPVTKSERIQGNDRTELPVTKPERIQGPDRTELPVTKSERIQGHDRTELPVTKTERAQDLDRTELPATQETQKSKTPEQEAEVLFELLKNAPENNQLITSQTSSIYGNSAESESSEKSTMIILPLNLPKRFDLWSWDPEEERKRQERWQKEQERLLQEKYQKGQEKLKEEWEKAQKEVEEEERRYHEEERKIIEETVVPLTPLASKFLSTNPDEQLPGEGHRDSESTLRSVTDWKCTQEGLDIQMSQQVAEAESWHVREEIQQEARKDQELMWDRGSDAVAEDNELRLEKQSINDRSNHSDVTEQSSGQQEYKMPVTDHSLPVRRDVQFVHDASWSQQPLTRQPQVSPDVRKKTASLDRNWGQQTNDTGGMRRSGSHENLGSGQSSSCCPVPQNQSPNRSVSGKKLCSTCGLPLGKGAAMIIETLSLYFHIQCFRCGICKGQLGDATTGTDVRIRNGLLNCNDCYIRSRTAGQPTTL